MHTDSKRLQQIIKNLLSNAFKFTHHGQVSLRVAVGARRLEAGQRRAQPRSDRCWRSPFRTPASAFRRTSSRSSSRRSSRPTAAPAANTAAPGLGLAISREIARLLGGEIRLVSTPGEGSTFTLYLPQSFAPQKIVRRAAVVADRTTPQLSSSRRRHRQVDRLRRAGARRCELSLGERSRTTIAAAFSPTIAVLLIVDNDDGFRPLRAGNGAAKSASRALTTPSGRRGHGPGARIPTARDLARHFAARHRRLARAGTAETRFFIAAHSGVRRLDGRSTGAGLETWRAGHSCPSRFKPAEVLEEFLEQHQGDFERPQRKRCCSSSPMRSDGGASSSVGDQRCAEVAAVDSGSGALDGMSASMRFDCRRSWRRNCPICSLAALAEQIDRRSRRWNCADRCLYVPDELPSDRSRSLAAAGAGIQSATCRFARRSLSIRSRSRCAARGETARSRCQKMIREHARIRRRCWPARKC